MELLLILFSESNYSYLELLLIGIILYSVILLIIGYPINDHRWSVIGYPLSPWMPTGRQGCNGLPRIQGFHGLEAPTLPTNSKMLDFQNVGFPHPIINVILELL